MARGSCLDNALSTIMSSFVNLRASRQSKGSKSYVQSTTLVQHSSSTLSSQPSNEGKVDETMNMGEIVYSLPPSIEVRDSDSQGRGLWSKAHYKAGSLYFQLMRYHLLTRLISRQYALGYQTTYRGLIKSTYGFILLELFWPFPCDRVEEVYDMSYSAVLQSCVFSRQ